MTIAVTGATGKLGKLIIAELKKRLPENEIIALVRNMDKAANLGVSSRFFDYNQPDLLAQSLQGVTKLLLISSNEIGQRITQHSNVINAAKKAGVQYLVYTSLLHADTSPLSVAKEHPETETAIKNSGIEYTILRNGWYHENYTDAIPAALSNQAFYGCAGDGKIASADRSDYAEAAAIVLTDENQHINKIYELVGDEPYTLDTLATEISHQTQKQIPYINLSEQEYSHALTQAGVDAQFAQLIANWDTCAQNGALFDTSKQLSQLLGRPTMSIAQAVQHKLAML